MILQKVNVGKVDLLNGGKRTLVEDLNGEAVSKSVKRAHITNLSRQSHIEERTAITVETYLVDPQGRKFEQSIWRSLFNFCFFLVHFILSSNVLQSATILK